MYACKTYTKISKSIHVCEQDRGLWAGQGDLQLFKRFQPKALSNVRWKELSGGLPQGSPSPLFCSHFSSRTCIRKDGQLIKPEEATKLEILVNKKIKI